MPSHYGLGGHYGDYYRGDYYRGDPFIHKTIGKVVGTVAGVVGKVVPGPVGALASGVQRVLSGSRPLPRPTALQGTALAPMPQSFTGIRLGGQRGITAGIERFQTQTTGVSMRVDPETGMLVRRRRRMNVANAKALRRALRRQRGFVKLARRALQGTGYKVTSRSAGRGGSRGVITKAEAARALRS